MSDDAQDNLYFQIETGQQDAPKHIPPDPMQAAWLAAGPGAMLSWGVNTFNDQEWSDGSLPLDSVQAQSFDPLPLMQQLKAAGFGYILPTTKHIDGFCTWATRTTDYQSNRTSLGFDVLERICSAARDVGLQVGLYFPLWDRREQYRRSDRDFAQLMKQQLAELLTNYGPIIELWVDGAWEKGGVDFADSERWAWREIYELVKAIQPSCQVGINGTTERPGQIIMYPCDFRIGEKRPPRSTDQAVWWCEAQPRCLPFSMVHTASAGGGASELFADGKWFYHADDQSVRSAEEIREEISQCQAAGAQYLLGLGPDGDYRLRKEDAALLAELAKKC